MKKVTKSPSTLLPSPLAAIESAIALRQKELSDLIANFHSSYVPTIEGGMTVDPFLLERMLEGEGLNGIDSSKTENLKTWIAAEKAKVTAQFEQRVREFCEARNVTYEGRYPSYVIGDLVSLEVRPATVECLIDNKKVRSLMFESAMPRLSALLEADANRQFSPDDFLNQLSIACQRAAALDATLRLDEIPIKAAFRELVFVRQDSTFFRNPIKNNYSEYTTDEFSRDIARLMASGKIVTSDGSRLNLGPTSTADGIAVRIEGGARNIGRIGFVQGGR